MLRHCLVFYILLALSAIVGAGSPEPYLAGVPELKLETKFKSGCARLGESILCDAVTKNNSEKSIWIYATVPEKTYTLRVTDQEGKAVLLTEIGKNANVPVLSRDMGWVGQELKPGGSRSDLIVLNEIFAITAPGTYRIEASRRYYLDAKHAQVAECKAEALEFCVSEK